MGESGMYFKARSEVLDFKTEAGMYLEAHSKVL